ncbi:MAG: YARHG domain-containing protein [Bacteroidetes bacterium]|nr:YARHG domain-containing protein [Bacteroidota bacterium]
MKRLTFLFSLVLFFACNDAPAGETETDANQTLQEETAETETPTEPASAEETTPVKFNKYLGYYVGDFEAKEFDSDQNYSYINRITISIEEMMDGEISGRSIVAGNDRPFSGTFNQRESGLVEVAVKEPGDDKYDGAFSFTINPDGSLVEGIWKAYNTGLAVPERIYELDKKTFTYNASLELPEHVGWAQLYNGEHPEEYVDFAEALSEDVLAFNPSSDKLSKTDVENMYQGDLEILRNSIYARHGYSFKNRKMRYIFDSYVDWYIPVSVDVRAQLTSLEKENIELVKRYEDHAEKYYDVFGR